MQAGVFCPKMDPGHQLGEVEGVRDSPNARSMKLGVMAKKNQICHQARAKPVGLPTLLHNTRVFYLLSRRCPWRRMSYHLNKEESPCGFCLVLDLFRPQEALTHLLRQALMWRVHPQELVQTSPVEANCCCIPWCKTKQGNTRV